MLKSIYLFYPINSLSNIVGELESYSNAWFPGNKKKKKMHTLSLNNPHHKFNKTDRMNN